MEDFIQFVNDVQQWKQTDRQTDRVPDFGLAALAEAKTALY